MRRLFLAALCLSLLAAAADSRAQYPAKEPVIKPMGNWHRLAEIGPGHAAVVTLRDGTLRGGWITGVDAAHLELQSAGQPIELSPSDIAVVRVQRTDRTLLYTVLGYLATATIGAVVVYNDDNHEPRDLIIVGAVAGIPGGLLGALIGDRTSGDVEIVP